MKSKRQAVIIIHGIGEQRPMRTLRGFVTSLLNFEKKLTGADPNKRTFWTKPDRISNSFELRKISSKGFPGKRSTTHFYEYHWAANMRDTKWRHILLWFWDLMFRNPLESRSYRLFFLWLLLWTLFLAWMTASGVLINDLLKGTSIKAVQLEGWQKIILALPFVLFILHNVFIGFIGDAARYLRIDVENIHQREIIRKNGVEMLKALHQSEDYDRIIVVGHSLGSVIAYDIITYLWIDFNKAVSLSQQVDYRERTDTYWPHSFGLVNTEFTNLRKVESWAKKAQEKEFRPEDIDQYQLDQNALWRSIQYERKSWLISDLITLGSPLTHGKLLMADSAADFKLRIEEREYPVSPPVLDGNDLTYPSGNGEKYLHHATPFAVTRWSNLYYKGDFIAGPLAAYFGPGIKDIRVSFKGNSLRKLNSFLNPLSHVYYWRENSKVETIETRKEYDAIKTLYYTMRLNDLECAIYPTEKEDYESE